MAKIIGSDTGLRFKTTERRHKENKRKIIAIIALLLVVVASASITTYLKERTETPEETTVEGEITLVPENDMKKQVNILVAGVTTSEEEVEFLFVVSMNTEESTFAVAGIVPPNTYDAEKPSTLVTSVEKANKIDVDRYIILNQKKFKAFVKNLGYYDIDLKKKIDYSSDEFSLNLLTGPQTLSGSKLFDYIRYTCMNSSENELLNEAKIISDYLKQNLNEKTTAKGDTLFTDLVNSCDTDINITDYTRYSTFLSNVSKAELNVSAISVSELEKE